MSMGQVTLSPEELEAMLDRAARRGARQALTEIGLHDEHASRDIHEVRDLLGAWRDTRRSILNTATKIVTTAILLFIGGAVWMSIKSNIGQ